MPDVMADRRDAPRFPLILIAEIIEIVAGAKMMARTSDVSRTGCYLDTLSPTPKGSMIQLRLTRGEEIFQTQAKVVYVSPGRGMGADFMNMSPRPSDLSWTAGWAKPQSMRDSSARDRPANR